MIRRFVCRLIGHDITVLGGMVRVCRRCEPEVMKHYRELTKVKRSRA